MARMWRFAVAVCAILACNLPGGSGQVPELPADPAAVCNRDTMYQATTEEILCAKTLYKRKDAVEQCCSTFARFYGPNSTLPSRNCFCVESYWAELQALSERHYMKWASYLDQCTDMGYPIYYYQDGEGPCAGPPPPSAPAPGPEAEPVPEPEPAVLPMRSFGGWLSGLGDDAWGAVSFTAGLVSLVGGGVMAWTFLYDACTDLRAVYKTKRASH